MSELQDTAFRLPFVAYALLITCAGNMDFMILWAVVSLQYTSLPASPE